MQKKAPPNFKKTQFKSGKEAVENGRKGGIASGIAKREKKTIQKILKEFLGTPAKSNPQIDKIAAKLGISSEKNIKELFTIVCTINSLKNGDLSDLEKLIALIGEETKLEAVQKEDDPLTRALKEEAEKMNNETD